MPEIDARALDALKTLVPRLGMAITQTWDPPGWQIRQGSTIVYQGREPTRSPVLVGSIRRALTEANEFDGPLHFVMDKGQVAYLLEHPAFEDEDPLFVMSGSCEFDPGYPDECWPAEIIAAAECFEESD